MWNFDFILNGLAQPWRTAGWAAALAVAFALIVLLMRYERTLVPRHVGRALFGLRLAILALLLIVFLQPTGIWTLNQEQTGRILVAIDVSESMSSTDAHAAPGEKLRWARALGMIGNPAIDARLDRWQAAFDAGIEPPWVDPGEISDPRLRDERGRERKANLYEILAAVDKLSRKEIASRLVTGTARPLIKRLENSGRVELQIFGGKSESADAATLDGAVGSPPEGVLPQVSDLSQGLLPAASGSSPIIGVVMLTDGRDNVGNDAVGTASRLGASRAPVIPVLMGSRLRPKDLAIASLDYPQTSFKDDKAVLRVRLNTAGFEGEPIEVRVLEGTMRNGAMTFDDPSKSGDGSNDVTNTNSATAGGGRVLKKTVTPTSHQTTVEFNLDASTVGRKQYQARVELRPGETREDNNLREFAINFVDDKVRIFLAEGEARWEFRFIEGAFSRDDRVELQKTVFQQPYMGVLNDTFFPRKLPFSVPPPALSETIFAQADLVILGDVAPKDIPETVWGLLEKFVSEGGGTLVLTAGKLDFPLSYRSPIVERLLPVKGLAPLDMTDRSEEVSPTERGFRLRLTGDGERESMFRFDTDPAVNRGIWNALPGHSWGLIGEARPGAIVYAAVNTPNAPPTLEQERKQAVIVQQNYGFGQVVWIGIDSTWRWRHRAGEKYHHRFWGQLARWAATNKALAGNDLVKFGPERSDVAIGEDVLLRARLLPQAVTRFPKMTLKAVVRRLDSRGASRDVATIPLKPDELRPLQHEGRAVGLGAGNYQADLIAENTGPGGGPAKVTVPFFIHERQTAELSDLSNHRELLDQLAGVSRGEVLMPDQLDQIAKMLEDPRRPMESRREEPLWDRWYLLVAFFLLLTSEWFVRKLNGLP